MFVRRIGNFFSFVLPFFGSYLEVIKGGLININRGAMPEAAKYDGRRVIETNNDTIRLENADRIYKMLMVIERCFRSL